MGDPINQQRSEQQSQDFEEESFTALLIVQTATFRIVVGNGLTKVLMGLVGTVGGAHAAKTMGFVEWLWKHWP